MERKCELPPGPKCTMSIYFTEEMHRRLVKRAGAETMHAGKRVTVGSLVRQAVNKYLEGAKCAKGR